MIKKIKSHFYLIGNLPLSRLTQIVGIKCRMFFYFPFYKFRFRHLGKNVVVGKPLLINHEDVTLKDNVIIWRDARIESVRNYAGEFFSPRIVFEEGASIQQRCHITAAGKIIIGRDSIISYDVMITDIDHEYADVDMPVGVQPLKISETRIGDNCFIGCGAKIQAGTILGKHCVVGANSVVRGTFDDYSVIVGSPARVVKKYDFDKKCWVSTKC